MVMNKIIIIINVQVWMLCSLGCCFFSSFSSFVLFCFALFFFFLCIIHVIYSYSHYWFWSDWFFKIIQNKHLYIDRITSNSNSLVDCVVYVSFRFFFCLNFFFSVSAILLLDVCVSVVCICVCVCARALFD